MLPAPVLGAPNGRGTGVVPAVVVGVVVTADASPAVVVGVVVTAIVVAAIVGLCELDARMRVAERRRAVSAITAKSTANSAMNRLNMTTVPLPAVWDVD